MIGVAVVFPTIVFPVVVVVLVLVLVLVLALVLVWEVTFVRYLIPHLCCSTDTELTESVGTLSSVQLR